MPSKESKQVMLQFIKESKRKLSKNEIADFMSSQAQEPYRTSKKTTYKMVDEAAESGSIRVTKHIRQGQNDQIVFNDKNNFNVLMSMIENLKKIVNEYNKIALEDIQKVTRFTFPPNFWNLVLEQLSLASARMWLKNKTLIQVRHSRYFARVFELTKSEHFMHLIHLMKLEQFMYHTAMSRIAMLVDSSINDVSDREVLHLRLADVLIASVQLNEVIFVISALKEGDIPKAEPPEAFKMHLHYADSVDEISKMLSNLEQIP